MVNLIRIHPVFVFGAPDWTHALAVMKLNGKKAFIKRFSKSL